jgi:hypothetical protein
MIAEFYGLFFFSPMNLAKSSRVYMDRKLKRDFYKYTKKNIFKVGLTAALKREGKI